MSTTVAVLTSAPKVVNGVRVATVKLSPSGFTGNARIFDRPGDYFPYEKGDRVRVQVVQDDPAAGVHITGLYGSVTAADGGNREIHGRGKSIRLYAPNGGVIVKADDGGFTVEATEFVSILTEKFARINPDQDLILNSEDESVRLDDGNKSAQQKVALIDQIREDLLSLQEQVNILVSGLDNGITSNGGVFFPVGNIGPTNPWSKAIDTSGAEQAKGGQGAVKTIATPEPL